MDQLTDISDRLTPSVPLEITFGAQPVATGRKFTTLLGHRAAAGGTGADYGVYTVVNVGDPDAARVEVEGLSGAGSQISKMAEAFVKANSAAGRSNFPAFRVVLIPNARTDFGPANEAIEAIKHIRSDMIVTCYPASDDTNLDLLEDLVSLISGIDRDLQGQFGSFVTAGSVDALATAVLYGINRRDVLVAYLRDTNTALVVANGDTNTGSKDITNIPDVTGIHEGALVTGLGFVGTVKVTNVKPGTVTVDTAAGSIHVATPISYQNVISQSEEIIASAHAGAMMQSVLPYRPLQGVTIGGLEAPRKTTDWISIDPNGASEQALVAGLSPLYIQPGQTVGFIRTRTTLTLKPDNVTAVTAYFDWQDVVTLNDFREDVYQITQNPPFNNNPGGAKASIRIAGFLKDEILRLALSFEEAEAFQAVKSLAPEFLVAPSSTSRGRFDFKIPVNVLPGLYVIAGNIQAVVTFDFTL